MALNLKSSLENEEPYIIVYKKELLYEYEVKFATSMIIFIKK